MNCFMRLSFIALFLLYSTLTYASISLSTIFGSEIIEEPILCALLQSKAVKRLEHIHQYGTTYYSGIVDYHYSRYDHSVGVLHLLRLFEADILEQIAGLLHDVSHTVFSHVGDHLVKSFSWTDSYQDRIFLWYLEHSDIISILNEYNIPIEAIVPKNSHFKKLEQELPDLCADRIEYILHGAFLESILSKQDIKQIIQNLRFELGTWYFIDHKSAVLFARCSLYLTKKLFAPAWNWFIYRAAAKALKRACKIQLFSFSDIHFSIDETIWNLLNSSTDQKIMKYLDQIKFPQNYFRETTEESYDLKIHPKCRVVNPLIKMNNEMRRLTDLDGSFAQDYFDYKKLLDQGIAIKYSSLDRSRTERNKICS